MLVDFIRNTVRFFKFITNDILKVRLLQDKRSFIFLQIGFIEHFSFYREIDALMQAVVLAVL